MGASLRDVELLLALYLEAAGLGLSTTSSPPSLYAGPFPAEGPDQLVAVRLSGGDEGAVYLGGGGTLAADVQVVVRGRRGQYDETRQLAFAVWEALHYPNLPGFYMVKSEGAGPLSLGPDELDRHRFSFNVAAEYAWP